MVRGTRGARHSGGVGDPGVGRQRWLARLSILLMGGAVAIVIVFADRHGVVLVIVFADRRGVVLVIVGALGTCAQVTGACRAITRS